MKLLSIVRALVPENGKLLIGGRAHERRIRLRQRPEQSLVAAPPAHVGPRTVAVFTGLSGAEWLSVGAHVTGLERPDVLELRRSLGERRIAILVRRPRGRIVQARIGRYLGPSPRGQQYQDDPSEQPC